tara:strand:+ start:401 stop:571 length:171 start_codon:yes stop_codon:yes gene_type:complete
MNIKKDVEKYLNKINIYDKYTIVNNSHDDLYILHAQYGKEATKKEIKKQLNRKVIK